DLALALPEDVDFPAMSGRGGLALGGWLALAAASGCGEEAGRPPVARIRLLPAYIPHDDGFHTAVSLDGSGSADQIDHPTAQRPRGFHWALPAGAMLDEGGAAESRLVIRLPGDRPAAVTLEVTDGDDHLTSSRSVIVGITLP